MRSRLFTALVLGAGLIAAGLGSGDAQAEEKKKKKKAKSEQISETAPTSPPTPTTTPLPPPPPPPVSCPGEFANDLRSYDSGVPTEITFVNGMADAISIFWINYDGQAQHYATLPPGEQIVQGTFLMHPWLVISEPLPPLPTEEEMGAGPNGKPGKKGKKAGKSDKKGKKGDPETMADNMQPVGPTAEQPGSQMPGPVCIGVYFPDDRERTVILQ